MEPLLLFATQHLTITLIILFIFGAMIGSFLNMLIYRYPIMLERQWACEHEAQPSLETFNLCVPRSHCPKCKKTVAWWMNIPLLSYLGLRGKCFHCKAPIGFQYFLTELIAAITTLIVFVHFSFSLQFLEVLFFTYGLIALSFIDFNHRILPDTIVYLLLWLGLIVSTQHVFVDPTHAIYGAILGYSFLWVIAQGYAVFRKKEGMGLGDCKMLAMIGAWVGAQPIMDVILIAAVLALLVSIMLLARKSIHKQTLIPFGPFIAIAGWSVVIYGDFLARWIRVWLM